MLDEDCAVCGKCWWHNCPNEADYSIDVDLKRNGLPLYSGSVDLCGGHTRFAQRNGGRLDLNWDAVAQALALQVDGSKIPRVKAHTL